MSDIIKKYVDYAGLQAYDGQIKGVISTDFVGATSSTDGAAGRVPAPDSGDENKYLRGDGTWAAVGSQTIDSVPTQGSSNAVSSGGVYDSEESIRQSVDEITSVIPFDMDDGWENKSWNGLSAFDSSDIWTDGDNIYYSEGSSHYVLDKSTSTWTTKTWYGNTNFDGSYIWTDGDNIYISANSSQYVLNKSTSTWTAKTWNGLTSFSAYGIWTDGDDIYYSDYVFSKQYVLNKSTSTWTVKTWNGLSNPGASYIWIDGDNIYYSGGSEQQYILNKATSTWTTKTWNGLLGFWGENIWEDSENIYYSLNSDHYVLNKSTSTWEPKTWNGLTIFNGEHVWTDGDAIYYSSKSGTSSIQKVLVKKGSFGTAATKDYTNVVTSGSNDLVTSGGVHTAISYVVFKGTTAQWTALSTAEKAKYELVVLTDD